MDEIFDNWIDKSGRTLSLSNIIRDLPGEQAAWKALTEMGYAAVAWDETGVRVRVVVGSVEPGTLDGLVANLKAVKRRIILETWDAGRWSRTEFADGGAFAGNLRAAVKRAS